MTTNTKPKYITTLTLSQKEMGGEVDQELTFSPQLGDGDEIPECFDLMSEMFLGMLTAEGIIDENGELIDETARNSLEVDIVPTGETKSTVH